MNQESCLLQLVLEKSILCFYFDINIRCHSLKSDPETTNNMSWLHLLWWLQAMRDLRHSCNFNIPLWMPIPSCVLDFFGTVSLISHTSSTCLPSFCNPAVQKHPHHCSHLATESSQSSLSKVSRESLDSIVQKLTLVSLQTPDPDSCIWSTWELSALLCINTERYVLCLQIFRPSRSVTGLKKTLLTLNAVHTYSCIFLSKCVN